MGILLNFIPIITFVLIFFSSGVYYTLQGVENAFYQVPITAAIIPSLIIAWISSKGDNNNKMDNLLKGASHPDIITMCIIFLFAGALGVVTQAIGCVDSTVKFALAIIPEQFLLIGIFIISALISTAIGSSMGTIAALASLVTSISSKGAFSIDIGIATLVGGAMFGDNMSIISDTTIAAVASQDANLKEKLKLNIKIALVAAFFTILALSFSESHKLDIEDNNYSLILISPYIFMILLAISGINVFIILVLSLLFSGIIGILFNNYNLISFARDISTGFHNMHDIMLLSILIGAISGLSNHNSQDMAKKIVSILPRKSGKKAAELVISLIVSLFDILLANNTIAIIFSGEITKEISKQYKIKAHEAATWLDIFSCVMQGIIPYGAQILLACTLANISPFSVIGQVYYCYILAIITLIFILLRPNKS